MFNPKSRRDFIKLSAYGLGTAILSFGISGCDDNLSEGILFSHGVASGDPLQDRVILWTRALPQDVSKTPTVRISWEVALDPGFAALVNAGTAETSAERDFTVKIDAAGLQSGTRYYYRFRSKDLASPVGKTRTLVGDDAEQVRLAVVSCSNFPAGRFHVYKEISKLTDIDAVVHLGDYLYEYQRGGYASAQAAALGREVLPAHEILTLADYRTRYAQYRSDADLQALHQNHPFIAVWDDHEVANNSWREGAINHQAEEGVFEFRKLQALQAYSEWIPVRPQAPDDNTIIYRSFKFGRLVALHMLDTRLAGRDQPLLYPDYFQADEFDGIQLQADITDPDRSLLGPVQREWIEGQIAQADTQWQVLGQQVLMGRMYLPGALSTQQISLAGFSRLVKLATMAAQGVELSVADAEYLAANRKLLSFPALPYNLDAWDAFEAERQNILQAAKASASNLIVLAGDSHNAWANDLVDASQEPCGVEFATPSVTSPGLEVILGIPKEAVVATEQQVLSLIKNLRYTNINDRGYMITSFTESEATAEYFFVSGILDETYTMLPQRSKKLTVKHGERRIHQGV
ncbi:MAG TPA: alkaline phosphatase D family protein [Oligoflexus sp.]|uniref:alkaline phosphatase D family protein n=1 Tax=Oligoflexus sp. TaxID=1971216 RepID=UPI002D67C653|nr:alkaline phosphatase D family protein [Oligoflexus sp.]HYX32314.1 alkaline phosphatase D family protein [Oligoflexus sp.]